jgi:ABC-2 type transport system ATP-binding protein
MSDSVEREIVFSNVSKFYGEVLGVNRVSAKFLPGITGLVGPNGSGKTTLLNLMTGLLKPTGGSISVRGISPYDSERLFQETGYCAQFDSFPRGFSGFQFVYSFLRVHGYSSAEADDRAATALERVKLIEAADRKIAGYSKGMRQRIKLAQAISHDPSILILDEPLNGLDPMARAEIIALFKECAQHGCHVIISSHILHEVDMISDRVILLNGGYVVAEGDIQSVRSEMPEHPIQVLVRCDSPSRLASRLFEMNHVVEVKIQPDQKGLLIRTKDADQFYLRLNEAILDTESEVETIAPADEDVLSVYQYLIGSDGSSA